MVPASKKTLEVCLHSDGDTFVIEAVDVDHYKQVIAQVLDSMTTAEQISFEDLIDE